MSRIEPECKLPGTKLFGWEDPDVALLRFMDEDLPVLKEYILLGDVCLEQEFHKSKKYNVMTRYSKKVYEAIMDPNRNLPALSKQTYPRDRASIDRRSRGSVRRGSIEMLLYMDAGRRENVYAWLTDEQFDHYSSHEGYYDLRRLVTGVTMEQITPLIGEGTTYSI